MGSKENNRECCPTYIYACMIANVRNKMCEKWFRRETMGPLVLN